MSNNELEKPPLLPWRTVHAVIWLVGLYILITRGWIFPGIFVILAISAVLEGIYRRTSPREFKEDSAAAQVPAASPLPAIPVPLASPSLAQVHRVESLPQFCPACSAPIRGHEVKWTGPQSANCPYCGTSLPMAKA